jgi:hypothetical protein
MIRECLKEIEKDRFKNYTKNLKSIIDNFDEYQLDYALQQGIAISENIIIQKNPNTLFNCYNNDQVIKGLMPICKLIETKLNKKLKEQIYS